MMSLLRDIVTDNEVENDQRGSGRKFFICAWAHKMSHVTCVHPLARLIDMGSSKRDSLPLS